MANNKQISIHYLFEKYCVERATFNTKIISRSKLFVILILLMTHGCSATDTTNPQNSRSIKESKKEGFFIKEYYVSKCTVDSFFVEEAWLEKGSFNNIKENGRVIREPEDWLQLVFKIDETKSAKIFGLKNAMSGWTIKDVQTGNHLLSTLNFLYENRLIHNVEAKEVDLSSTINITLAGSYYYKVLINQVVYIEAIMYDTPIFIDETWDRLYNANELVNNEYEIVQRVNHRMARLKVFYEYLSKIEKGSLENTGLETLGIVNDMKSHLWRQVRYITTNAKRYYGSPTSF